MVCDHRRYKLGDANHDINFNECSSWEDVREQIEETYSPFAIKPLYLYDHSGITISTTPFSCRWDSGQVGWIFITKELLDKREIAEENRTEENYSKWLDGECNEYDQFLTGDVYGFRVIKYSKCESCGYTHETEEDSCWGYFGDNWKENGLFEAAGYTSEGVSA